MFGLFTAVPETVATAWGARFIYPDDMLPDRQGFRGVEASADGRALIGWLNGGPLGKAKQAARAADAAGKLSRDGDQTVILYRDGAGVFVACPNRSHGYLYVAAWLHNGEPDKQPGAEFRTL